MVRKIKRRADTVIVLDFETTGLSPNGGDRAIDIGAVRIEKGKIRERFQSLMNPGKRVVSFIEEYTGITNAMLKTAPPCTTVMAECRRINRSPSGEFACSMLASRRLYPHAPNHKLDTLMAHSFYPNARHGQNT